MLADDARLHGCHTDAWAARTIVLVALGAITPSIACTGKGAPRPATLPASLVHLDEELGHARVHSGTSPPSAREESTWNFREPRTDWRVLSSDVFPGLAHVTLEKLDDGVRLALAKPNEHGDSSESRRSLLLGGIAIDLAERPLDAWTGLRVRARTHTRLFGIAAACNVDSKDALPNGFAFFGGDPGTAPVFNDGSVQEYMLPLSLFHDESDSSDGAGATSHAHTLRSIAVVTSAPATASLDILSVTLVPRGADFLEDTGVRSITRESTTRRTIFAHVPAALAWKVRIPERSRLDLGLTCGQRELVNYRVTITAGAGEPQIVMSEAVDNSDSWLQRSIDLSKWSGTEVELSLEATSESVGAVALWGAPIISGDPSRAIPTRPNVIFYVIDGGGADLMSVYGYNRRTTPYLERLAAEGVVFENAHSNSTWTQASTASFMTSLHHSVLGGLRRGVHSTPVPPKAVTMAEHMHRGGYQTAVFTTNPNAARVIGLDRSVDVLHDGDTGNNSTSSSELHDLFWAWRHDYPGQPYWVHFQTTDVHQPNHPPPPFAGLFVRPEDHARAEQWDNELFQKAGDLFGTTSVVDFYDKALSKAGIDRQAFFNARRGLYDETMAHQDRELERLVERLKADGEWENTLLIIASDHGHPAGTFARFGRGLIEPQPDAWEGALFDSYSTRVPLIFVWPRRITKGQRVEQPVSMIDVLPTILDLARLPAPDVMQGRSLAPLCLGGNLDPRPVILDEFRVDEGTNEMVGNIEMIDGRWGASLEIGSSNAEHDGERGRHSVPAGGRWGAVHPFFADAPRLLLYDLWNDPFAVHAVNSEHPELVERYRLTLHEHWKVHCALAERFSEASNSALTPEMLKQLQALGYIR